MSPRRKAPRPPRDPQALTARQAEVLGHIVRFCKRKGFGPTVRELMVMIGVASPNGVTCHLRYLRDKGAIVWEPKQARTIRPTKLPSSPFRLPAGGSILPDGRIVLFGPTPADSPQALETQSVATRSE